MTVRFWLNGVPLAEADKRQLTAAVLESVVKHEDKSEADTTD